MEKVAIERSIWIDAPRERVWQAVTDPAQIAQWFAPGTSFTKKGNIISIHMGEMDIEVAMVDFIDPPRQVTTRQLPDKVIATTYTLEEENGGTRITVTESGLETLTEEARKQHLDQKRKGWELALENLKAFIDGKPLVRPEGF